MPKRIVASQQTSRIGMKFGLLMIAEIVLINGKTRFRCRCDCGGETVTAFDKLGSGHTTSCGCVQRSAIVNTATKHGLSGRPEYRVWKSMRDRCNRKTCPEYPRYGGRGITVSTAWDSFEQFFADMGPKPTPKHTIERMNNNLGYCRENCRWATTAEQARNTSKNVFLTHEGITLCVQDWEVRKGYRIHTIHVRLKRGWSAERAIDTPPN